MNRTFLSLLFCMLAYGATRGGVLPGTSSWGGLSGFPGLPASETLDEGVLRLQFRLESVRPRGSSENLLVLPLSLTRGMIEGLEAGAEIPLYLVDPVEGRGFAGDITVGAAWLYETARGGSSIVFRGLLRVPTGSETRDRGSELEFGVSTGTTFRLFRLQAAGSYVLSGGKDPFSGGIDDYMRFSMGGASYVSRSVQLVCSMDGTTSGEMGAAASGLFFAFDGFTFFGTLRLGMSGWESYRVSAGLSWTGRVP